VNEKLEALRALIDKEHNQALKLAYPNLPPDPITIKPGIKYIKIDIRNSGRYMVEVSTGNIYGIKAYGVIHRGHRFGNLDTINEWNWSGYRAFKRGGYKP
jgi:hypothetical protein